MKRVYFYKITNLIDGKRYIGQSVNPSARWGYHKYYAARLEKIKHPQYLWRAMALHGSQNFQFQLIASSISYSKEEVDLEEEALIKQNQSMHSEWGYNIRPGGNSRGNWQHSESTKRKLKENWHQNHPREGIERTAAASRGKQMSEEQRRKISETNKGRKFSLGHKQPPEVIEKRRLALRKFHGNLQCSIEGCSGRGGYKILGKRYCEMHVSRWKKHRSFDLQPRKPPKNKGIPLSEETKKKLSLALRGKVPHNKGMPMPDHVKKILVSLSLGREPVNKRHFSDEEIRKILTDKRGARKVGKDFGASYPVIKRIRDSFYIDPLTGEVKKIIKNLQNN